MLSKWREKELYRSVGLLLVMVFFHKNAEACVNGSSSVGDCLHTYLERDFPSIEAIVFRKKQSHTDESVLLLDGPELEDQCHRIAEVVGCLEDLLPKCYFYDQFFPFRHLVASLRKSVEWVCTPHHLRNRFRTLLTAFNCLETARQRVSTEGQPCFRPHIPVNICELVSHVKCTEHYITECPSDARSVYQDLNKLFLDAWCTGTRALSSGVDAITASSITCLALHFSTIYVQWRFT